MALSLVLVVGALLFVRTLRNLQARSTPGFRPEGILVASLDLRRAGLPGERRSAVHAARSWSALRALPGVDGGGARPPSCP